MSEFSTDQEAGQGVAPCDESIIPIFPLRYTLQSDVLDPSSGRQGYVDPSWAAAARDRHYDLMPIRQGYVYIYADDHVMPVTDNGGQWQIFRYHTSTEDENSQEIRSDVDLGTGGMAYTFRKFQWLDGHAGGRWRISASQQAYPYAFVSNQVSRVWIAYSEYRWPAHFFQKAQNDTTFRGELMVEVDVAGRSGDHVHQLSDLASISAAFVDGAPDTTAFDLENALRASTAFQRRATDVARCENSRQNGVAVALPDPLGEHLDYAAAARLLAVTRSNFLAEYQYPMVTGQHVKQIRDMENEDAIFFGFSDGLLNSRFDIEMAQINVNARKFNTMAETLIARIAQAENRTDWGTAGKMVEVCQTEVEATSGDDHEEVAGFLINITARAQYGLALLDEGSAHLMSSLDGTGGNWAEKLKKTLGFIKDLLDLGKVLHESVPASYNYFLTTYGREMALSVIRSDGGAVEVRALVRTTFRMSVGSFSNAEEVSSEFRQVMTQQIDGLAASPNRIVTLEQSAREMRDQFARFRDPDATRIGVRVYHSRISIIADAQTRTNIQRAQGLGYAMDGLGFAGGWLSLYMSIAGYNVTPNRNVTSVARAAADPTVQIIAGFAEAYSATHGAATTFLRTPTGAQAARAALSTVFRASSTLANAVQVNAATGAWAAKSLSVFARIAGGVGIAFSLVAAHEGWQRADMKMFTGNAMMAIGGAALILGATGIGAIIAVVVIIIGFIITLFSNSDGENWVFNGFWGTSSDYWQTDRRTIDDLIERAKVLAYPDDPNHERIRAFFEREMEDLIDRFSTLEIKNPADGDGQLEIHCGVIQRPSDMTRVSVSAEYSYFRMGRRPARISSLRFLRSGIAAFGMQPPSGTQISDWGEAHVNVTVIRRISDSNFEESENFEPDEV